MTKAKTIHTSRTIMFAELAKVMDSGFEDDSFRDSLLKNVTGKKSSSGVEKTANYLKLLYGFDIKYEPFLAFKYFWKIADSTAKPILTFIYAVNHDVLLAESIAVLQMAQIGEKVTIELLEEYIEKYHPNQYSKNTRKSLAQNMASSWKQAGFIEGKVRNIRVQPEMTFLPACFAFLLAYIKGDRGDFIWNSIGVKSLCLKESRLRELAFDCAKRDLMQYQHAGSVTAISFNNLMTKIGINGISN